MRRKCDINYPTAADVLTLLNAYAAHQRLAVSTAGRRVAGTDRLASECMAGRITQSRAALVTQKFARAWPSDLPWPANIRRPSAASRRAA